MAGPPWQVQTGWRDSWDALRASDLTRLCCRKKKRYFLLFFLKIKFNVEFFSWVMIQLSFFSCDLSLWRCPFSIGFWEEHADSTQRRPSLWGFEPSTSPTWQCKLILEPVPDKAMWHWRSWLQGSEWKLSPRAAWKLVLWRDSEILQLLIVWLRSPHPRPPLKTEKKDTQRPWG